MAFEPDWPICLPSLSSGWANCSTASTERVRLEAAKAILDRHLGRPAIQADISLHRAEEDGHLAALLQVAQRRALEPIVLEDVEVEVSTETSSTRS
jgi:hypothetical protein